jgi:uncharacterized membrane protein SirB2
VGAVFQLLLLFGAPLAEYSWGGKYQGALPQRLRVSSLIACLLLIVMGLVLLTYTNVLTFQLGFLSSKVVIWIITAYMALNTLGNLASKSKKEKLFMTPQTLIAFCACLVVAIY